MPSFDPAAAAPTSLALHPYSDSGLLGDGITFDTTPTVTGLAAPGTTITLRDGASILGTAVADGVTGAWSITSTELANGLHGVTATASDGFGNISDPALALALLIDDQPPTGVPSGLALHLYSDSGTTGDGITFDTTPLITGIATPGSLVVLFEGDVALGGAVADASSGAWLITSGFLDNGVRSLSAREVDGAGNSSAAALALTLLIDNLPAAAPTGLVLHPFSDTGLGGDGITFDTTPTVTGFAEAGARVSLLDGASLLGTTTADAITGAWSIDSSDLAIDTYALTARQTDAAGNVSEASSALVVRIDNTVPDRPVVTGITEDTDIPGDGVTSDHTPFVSGTGMAGGTIRVFIDGTPFDAVVADGAGQWFTAQVPVTEGLHALTAEATSRAGLSSGQGEPFALLVFSGSLHFSSDPVHGQSYSGLPGDDFLFVTGDTNTIEGMGGSDTLIAAGWSNTLFGGSGNDSMDAGFGFSTIDGGQGNNTIEALGWDNVIVTGDGADAMHGGDGHASIVGGDGDKTIEVFGWNDLIVAGNGIHVLAGPQGEASVTFGDGDSAIDLAGWNNAVTVGRGHHAIVAGQGLASVTVTGTAATSAVITLDGFSNQVSSQAAMFTRVSGGLGNSVISTGAGDDRVFAGGFTNAVSTGAGHDEIHLDAGSAIVNTGAGSDTVWFSGTLNLLQVSASAAGIDDIWGFDAAGGDLVDTMGWAGPRSFSQSGDVALLTIGGQDVARFHGYGLGADLTALAASIW